MKNRERQKSVYTQPSENKAIETNIYFLTIMNLKELEFDRKLSKKNEGLVTTFITYTIFFKSPDSSCEKVITKSPGFFPLKPE